MMTSNQMAQLLRERVQRVYGMTLLEYARARRAGTLPENPGSAPLEVFAGDFGLRR
jgi:methylphosphotriester-DNA--protein-cysteine methyltransferase